MKRIAIALIALSLVGPVSLVAQSGQSNTASSAVAPIPNSQQMQIKKSGSQQHTKGSAAHFTGSVQIEPLFSAHDPSRVTGASVTFAPGARSAWHTHPLGQILIVTDGVGWIQQAGGPVREIRNGDVIWTPPGVKHWHGATPHSSMTHIAIQEMLNGKSVEWMEKVSDKQYRAASESEESNSGRNSSLMKTSEDPSMLSPVLNKYEQGVMTELWKRPELSPRDRSIVTIAALIARNQTIEMPRYFNLALDSGVKPREISEIITQLAFYSGWANAVSADAIARDVFAKRGIGADQLPAVSPKLLPLDEAAEEKRATMVEQQYGKIAPGLVHYTTTVLFRDLWLRPDLSPRDRSLVTVSALIATGHFAQLTYHLNKAMDNGLTAEQAGEVVTQLAFYAGWPNAFSAVSVVKDVVEKRSR